MASYKSQFAPLRRTDDRAPSTRLPQRSVTPTTNTTLPKLAPQSRLQKRRSSYDEPPSSRGVSVQRHPVRKSSRQGSATRAIPVNTQSTLTTGSKFTAQSSTSRLPKLEVPPNSRTPSLGSGSSASTIESPRSSFLRRTRTSIGVAGSRQALRARDDSMSSQEDRQPTEGVIPGGYKDPFTETALGISLPASSNLLPRLGSEAEMFNKGLYSCEIGPTDILPLPVPQYALSSTPSTRYSESPGAFSISSTPTSMSSYSPGTTLSKTSLRTRQASPLENRLPPSRHRTPDESNLRHPHTLSTVRESSTSSSSVPVSNVVSDAGWHEMQLSNGVARPPLPQSSHYSVARPRIQAPPEFAHLVDQPPISTGRRPSRPSRDGTPEIAGLQGPSPVIQSNISNFLVSHHRRTSSSESRNGFMLSTRSKTTIPSKPSSRIPSPNTSSLPTSTSRAPDRGPTPDIQSDREMQHAATLPVPAPSPGKSSRFGFFTLRNKTEPIVLASKNEARLSKKGPVAGTGHEGYGRHAIRGRSGSSLSVSSIGRSISAGRTNDSLDHTPATRKSSITSNSSTDMDDFLLNRLAPVVIRGTGNSSEFCCSPEPMESKTSLDVSSRHELNLKKAISNTSKTTLQKAKPTLLPSAMPDTLRPSPKKKITMGSRRPSESDDDKRSFLPAMRSRRTSRASQTTQGNASVVSLGRASDKSRKGSINDAITGKESKKSKAEGEQPKPSKRWNFFQRAHAAPRAIPPVAAPTAAISANPVSRSVAHYALMDQSGLDLDDIEQLMKEATTGDEGTESALSDEDDDRKERMHSMLLPPKPLLPINVAPQVRAASPKVFLRSDVQAPAQQQLTKLTINTNVHSLPERSLRQSLAELTPFTDLSASPSRSVSPTTQIPMATPVPALMSAPAEITRPQEILIPFHSLPSPGPPPTSPPPRPSRLAHVGRIPQVVSTRRQPRRPSTQSFSRPFAADQPRPMALPRTSFDSIGSVFATAGPAEPYPILHGLNTLTHGSATAIMSPLSDKSDQRSSFFKFPPRKDSEVSFSSSSGVWSFASAAGTAVIPIPGAPLSDDELWNEYDDLIDDVLSPVTSRESGELSNVRSQHPSLEPLPLKTKASRNSHKSVKSVKSDKDISHPSTHLRRSRLLAVLHSTQSPHSSVSFTDFLVEYGEKKISVIDPVTGRLSLPASPRLSTGSTTKRSTRSSLPASLPRSARQSRATIVSRSSKDCDSISTNIYRDSSPEIADTQADGLSSMANLRFGALMTSKWLSFGRVLFSPVHFDLKDLNEDRILVVDGLGKDWSYYCALTYPEASVYDIGPEPSPSQKPAEKSSEPWSTLSNHRHICHPSLSTAFPFPMNFFACVVLRFPSALPSSVHRFVLSEVKRVLRPGGYLEFSVLDMDLVNMGNRARRAVRGLKMKMQQANEYTSLRNISDEIMAGIGRKGFVECNRCIVGVPVAGKLRGPEGMELSSIKRTGSVVSSASKSSGVIPSPKSSNHEVPFSDLLKVSSPSQSTDNGITHMVARVGRWWYSRCYESILIPLVDESSEIPGNPLKDSIWRDTSLIKECEKRGTSFKLLIGYAQKPEVGVRRTVSV